MKPTQVEKPETKKIWPIRFLQDNTEDLLVVAGAACLVVGAGLLHPVAALFTAGVFLIVFGCVLGFIRRREVDS